MVFKLTIFLKLLIELCLSITEKERICQQSCKKFGIYIKNVLATGGRQFDKNSPVFLFN